jgi:hypothetical protein
LITCIVGRTQRRNDDRLNTVRAWYRDNQEDSLIINQGCVDRGLFNGCKFTFYKTELEQREEFGNPDATTTADIKAGSYEKLTDGIIKNGTHINKGDAIIGKYVRITKGNEDDLMFSDRSVIYKDDEPAIVHNVIVDRNEEDERFAKVGLRKIRPVAVGDKFSAKGTAEVLTDHGWIQFQNLDITNHKVATLREDKFLDYVVPSGLSTYEYKGDMYHLETPQLNMCVTKNHKLYIKKRYKNNYELIRTPEMFGKYMKFKKDATNSMPYQEFFIARADDGTTERYPMDAWLKLLGMFIADGFASRKTSPTNPNRIVICAQKLRKQTFIQEFATELNIHCNILSTKSYISGSEYPALFNELELLSLGSGNKHLPEYVWNLSQDQSQTLINSLVDGDGLYNSSIRSARYFTTSNQLANEMNRLVLHAGWSGSIKCMAQAGDTRIMNEITGPRTLTYTNDLFAISINKKCHESAASHSTRRTPGSIERYESYEGTVYCLEVPDTHTHVYYMRDDMLSPPCWTGNSSRAGLILFWPEWSIKECFFNEML